MDATLIEVSQRDTFGKKLTSLRKLGIVPLHLYGGTEEPLSLQGDSTAVVKAVSQVGHHLPIYLLFTETSKQEAALVKEIQRDPVTNRVLHVDFLRVDVNQIASGRIPISLVGDSPAIKRGGTLNQTLSHLLVECLPMEMPSQIDFDISILSALDSIARVSDLVTPPGITILSSEEEVVARISAPRLQGTQSSESLMEAAPANVQVIGQDQKSKDASVT